MAPQGNTLVGKGTADVVLLIIYDSTANSALTFFFRILDKKKENKNEFAGICLSRCNDRFRHPGTRYSHGRRRRRGQFWTPVYQIETDERYFFWKMGKGKRKWRGWHFFCSTEKASSMPREQRKVHAEKVSLTLSLFIFLLVLRSLTWTVCSR